MAFRKNWKIKSFNSRPRNEVDGLPALPCLRSYPHFNSRPHEEVDRQLRSIKCHRLHFNSRPREEVDISYCPRRAGLLLFQLTTSQGGRHSYRTYAIWLIYFNSRPHEEVDRKPCLHWRYTCISTHDLTRRSTLSTTIQ